MSWLFGKKKAPDGSTIIRHGDYERRLGFTDESTAGFTEARESAYTKLFGEAVNVSHELVPQIPHIDVYTYRRARGSNLVTALVTGGMSDLPMTMPRGADKAPRRVELIFYCSEAKAEYIDTLRWLAHFPHDSKSWLGDGHTMPNGNPPSPFWGSDALDTILFMPPVVVNDQKLPEELKLGGDPVHFLWVVPLTTAECNFKLKKGFQAILDLFDQHRHPHIFDPARKSYV
jgi:hypothetical protein